MNVAQHGWSTMVLLLAVWWVGAAPDFSLVGFAEGVTGGNGGKEVTVSNGSDFKKYCTSSDRLIIKIAGKISGTSVKIASNKTLLGVGTTGEITKSTISFGGSNVIIRNLTIHHQGKGADLITMSGASNIWIDHCEIYCEKGDLNGDGKVDLEGDIKGGDVDWYDGLIDMTKGTHNITISWNRIHDSFKAMLCGASDSDLSDRKITFHHNHFYNLWERVPSYRGGQGHAFNNYYSDIEHSALNLRMGAKFRIEGCVFENVGSGEVDSKTKIEWGPIGGYYSKTTGCWDVKDNVYIDCKGNQPEVSTCSYTPPYVYSNVLHPASEVKAIVTRWAGVGTYNESVVRYSNNRRNEFRPASTAKTGIAAYNCKGEKVCVQSAGAKSVAGVLVVKDVYGVRVMLDGVR